MLAEFEDGVDVELTGKVATDLIAHLQKGDVLHLPNLVMVGLEMNHATDLRRAQDFTDCIRNIGKSMNWRQNGPIGPATYIREPRHERPRVIRLAHFVRC